MGIEGIEGALEYGLYAVSVDVPGLVKQLRTLKSSDLQDEAGRQSLFEAVRTIAAALETPGDAVNRIAQTSLQTIAARTASDLNLFETLSKQDISVFYTTQLAETTKAERNSSQYVIGRLLRYLAGFSMVEEIGENQWAATEITKTLSMPGLRIGIYHKRGILRMTAYKPY
ncbi:hypothetical protein ABVK25_007465 [Lepraria finkii]|uniref:Uncharacterized protein n=1 Tax=Lepraria finkii TaxID=1340010 RepID=A0ABR4B5Y3_9LECA